MHIVESLLFPDENFFQTLTSSGRRRRTKYVCAFLRYEAEGSVNLAGYWAALPTN
jgi:hypothetical protein